MNLRADPADVAEPTRQPTLFLLLYALAWAGGAVAYVPFLTILLPARIELMTPEPVRWLAYMSFTGAIAASVGGVVFGWLSDLSGRRVPWIAVGLLVTVGLLSLVPLATSPLSLLVLIVVWQLSLNMMLAPLAAWAADQVPPAQLGSLGGLLAFSPALGSAAGALVTISGLASPDGRLFLVGVLVVLCVVPALAAAGTARDVAPLLDRQATETSRPRSRIVAMWIARVLLQIAEAALFAYLYFYFRSIDPASDTGSVARLFSVVVGTSVPVALVVGRWSDRHHRPIAPLIGCALVAATALGAMALASGVTQATAAYVVFGVSATVFLSLHSAQTFRVLGRGSHGRDLGLFNLTNTAPSLIMPWLAASIIPSFGYSTLFGLLAIFALGSAVILLLLVHRNRRGSRPG
ncbi:MFS transporter [Sphingomonas sp. ASV193]|uniref:MFS transporter n=1 Tax=Sphingomonas sp. ASV193 TaxID=3144405 RepID=UPI0032E928EE